MPTIKSSQKFYYHMTILEQHLDLFAHVNNAAYLQILEQARWDIISNGGFGVEKIQSSGIGPVILEINIKFIKELKLHDKIVIETQVTELTNRKIHKLVHFIRNEKEEICCHALFSLGLMDLEKRKLIEPTPEWYNSLGVEVD